MQSGEEVRPRMEHCMAFFTVEMSCGIRDTSPTGISVTVTSKGQSSPITIFTGLIFSTALRVVSLHRAEPNSDEEKKVDNADSLY